METLIRQDLILEAQELLTNINRVVTEFEQSEDCESVDEIISSDQYNFFELVSMISEANQLTFDEVELMIRQSL